MYDTPARLKELIGYFLAHPEERRRRMIQAGAVARQHTYAKAVRSLLDDLIRD
jgi:spore maturation protein CgeB